MCLKHSSSVVNTRQTFLNKVERLPSQTCQAQLVMNKPDSELFFLMLTSLYTDSEPVYKKIGVRLNNVRGNGHSKRIKNHQMPFVFSNNTNFFGRISKFVLHEWVNWHIRFHWKHKMYSSLGYSKNYLKIHVKVTLRGSFPESAFKLKGHVIVGLQILHQTI